MNIATEVTDSRAPEKTGSNFADLFFSTEIGTNTAISREYADIAERHNFTVLAQKKLSPELGVLLHLLDKESGLTLFRIISPPDSVIEPCALVSVRTPPNDNSGTAHLIEHSLLCTARGSSTPFHFEFLSKSGAVSEINAATFGLFTNYHIRVQNPEFLPEMRDYLCAHVVSGSVDREVFERERGIIVKVQDPNGGQRLVISGRLYGEMFGRHLEPAWVSNQAILSALYPHSPLKYWSAGLPESIRELKFETFAAVHAEQYVAHNMAFAELGNHSLESTLQGLRPYLVASSKPVLEPPSPDGMGEPVPSLSIQIPTNHRSFGVSWRINAADPVEDTVLVLISEIFSDSPESPLKKIIKELNLEESIYVNTADYDVNAGFGTFSIELGCSNPNLTVGEALIYSFDCIFEVVKRLQFEGLREELVLSELNRMEYSAAFAKLQPRYGQDLLELVLERWQMKRPILKNIERVDRVSELTEALTANPKLIHDVCAKWLQLPDDMQRADLAGERNFTLFTQVPNEDLADEVALTEAAWIARQPEADAIETVPLKSSVRLWVTEGLAVPQALILQNQETRAHASRLSHIDQSSYPLTFLKEEGLEIGNIGLLFDLKALSPAAISTLKTAANVALELGTQTRAASEFNTSLMSNSGGLSFGINGLQVNGDFLNPNHSRIFLSANLLARAEHWPEAIKLTQDLIQNPNWTDKKNLRALFEAKRRTMSDGLLELGSQYTYGMLRSLAGFSGIARIVDAVEGVGAIDVLNHNLKMLRSDPDEFARRLARLWQDQLAQNRLSASFVGSSLQFEGVQPLLDEFVHDLHISNKRNGSKRFQIDEINEAVVCNNPAATYTASYFMPTMPKELFPVLSVVSRLLGIRREVSLYNNAAYSGYCGEITELSGAPVLSFSFLEETNLFDSRNLVLESSTVLLSAQFSEEELRWAKQAAIEMFNGKMDPYERQAAELTWHFSGESESKRQKFIDRIANTTLEDIRQIGVELNRKATLLSEVVLGPRSLLSAFVARTGKEFRFRKF